MMLVLIPKGFSIAQLCGIIAPKQSKLLKLKLQEHKQDQLLTYLECFNLNILALLHTFISPRNGIRVYKGVSHGKQHVRGHPNFMVDAGRELKDALWTPHQ